MKRMEVKTAGVKSQMRIDFTDKPISTWGRQIIVGIGWEIVAKTVELNDDQMPDFTVIPKPGEHWRHHIRINASLYAILLGGLSQGGCSFGSFALQRISA